MLLTDQPPSRAPSAPVLARKKGSSHVPFKVRLCLAWNADRPRSKVGSYQSRPYCTTLLKSCELIPLASSIDSDSVYEACARQPLEKRF